VIALSRVVRERSAELTLRAEHLGERIEAGEGSGALGELGLLEDELRWLRELLADHVKDRRCGR
jgi:hypothetical protein